MPPSPVLCRQSASTAPRLRASTALPDSDPKLIAEMLTTDFGRNAPRRSRAAPITLAHGKFDLVRGHRRRRRHGPTEGAVLDHRIAGRVLHVVVGAEPEVVVLLLRRGVHPPTLIAGERALLVVGRDDVLPQLGADSFDQVPTRARGGGSCAVTRACAGRGHARRQPPPSRRPRRRQHERPGSCRQCFRAAAARNRLKTSGIR